MYNKLLAIDYNLIVLNAASVTTLAMSWFTDNLNTAGGFLVMVSIAVLNFSKAYNQVKSAKNNKLKAQNQDENK